MTLAALPISLLQHSSLSVHLSVMSDMQEKSSSSTCPASSPVVTASCAVTCAQRPATPRMWTAQIAGGHAPYAAHMVTAATAAARYGESHCFSLSAHVYQMLDSLMLEGRQLLP